MGILRWNKIPAPALAFTFGFGFSLSLALFLAFTIDFSLALALALASSIIGFDALKGGCTYSIFLQNREKTDLESELGQFRPDHLPLLVLCLVFEPPVFLSLFDCLLPGQSCKMSQVWQICLCTNIGRLG